MKQVNSYFEGEGGELEGGGGWKMINDKIIRGEPICMKPSLRQEEGGGRRQGDEESFSPRYNCSVMTTIIIQQ